MGVLLNGSTEGMRGRIDAEMQEEMGTAYRSVANWPTRDAFPSMGILKRAPAPAAAAPAR